MDQARSKDFNRPPKVEADFELKEAENFLKKRRLESAEKLDYEKRSERVAQEHEKRELKELIKKLAIPSEYRDKAHLKAKELKTRNEQEKLLKILEIFKKEGFQQAVATLEALNDPFVADLFHDFVIMKGLHRPNND